MQEYVDHSSTLFKFYVLGEEVFHAVKKSTPNVGVLMELSKANQSKPLVFDRYSSDSYLCHAQYLNLNVKR